MKPELKDAIASLQSSIQQVSELAIREIGGEEGGEGGEGDEEGEIDTHIGPPTERQLAKINALTGTESTAEEWMVVPFMASNNFVDVDWRVWDLGAIADMARTFPGRLLMLDHRWGDSTKHVGLVFDALMCKSTEVPEGFLQAGGFEEQNREILKEQGYWWMYLCAAIPATSAIANEVAIRLHNDCSTGSNLSEPYYLCPDCSKEHGRPVGAFERVRDGGKNDGDWVCPHVMPGAWEKAFASIYDLQVNFASYSILGGKENAAVENSLCTRGALFLAGVIRPDTFI